MPEAMHRPVRGGMPRESHNYKYEMGQGEGLSSGACIEHMAIREDGLTGQAQRLRDKCEHTEHMLEVLAVNLHPVLRTVDTKKGQEGVAAHPTDTQLGIVLAECEARCDNAVLQIEAILKRLAL